MILYTPVPPQLTVEYTPVQMARLDKRFAWPELWPSDPALLLQDSARLLGAYLNLRTSQGDWKGDPLAPANAEALTETEWRRALCLETVPTLHLGAAHLNALTSWTAGVVTLFTAADANLPPRLSRVLNLSNFFDRLELEFLLERHDLDVRVLRAHRLGAAGRMTLWRAEWPRSGPLADSLSLPLPQSRAGVSALSQNTRR